uniref:Uncharacterized protein n=1 Tax=Anguilla anguilla TaxID=7936 RepID=A0A0E9SVW3_ANGAN
MISITVVTEEKIPRPGTPPIIKSTDCLSEKKQTGRIKRKTSRDSLRDTVWPLYIPSILPKNKKRVASLKSC